MPSVTWKPVWMRWLDLFGCAEREFRYIQAITGIKLDSSRPIHGQKRRYHLILWDWLPRVGCARRLDGFWRCCAAVTTLSIGINALVREQKLNCVCVCVFFVVFLTAGEALIHMQWCVAGCEEGALLIILADVEGGHRVSSLAQSSKFGV